MAQDAPVSCHIPSTTSPYLLLVKTRSLIGAIMRTLLGEKAGKGWIEKERGRGGGLEMVCCNFSSAPEEGRERRERERE